MTRRPQITRRWEGYKRAESGFCPELCCSGEAVSHTSDVHVTPLWEDADTERYHGQKAPLGSISLKEKHLLGSTEQIQFHPSFPTFCSSFVAVQGLEEFELIAFILFLAVLGLHGCKRRCWL